MLSLLSPIPFLLAAANPLPTEEQPTTAYEVKPGK